MGRCGGEGRGVGCEEGGVWGGWSGGKRGLGRDKRRKGGERNEGDEGEGDLDERITGSKINYIMGLGPVTKPHPHTDILCSFGIEHFQFLDLGHLERLGCLYVHAARCTRKGERRECVCKDGEGVLELFSYIPSPYRHGNATDCSTPRWSKTLASTYQACKLRLTSASGKRLFQISE